MVCIKKILKNPYNVFICVCIIHLVFGFISDSPFNIFRGLISIVMQPDILLTDYIEIGGLGAAFVNVGITGLLCTFMLILSKHTPSGDTIMALWLIIAFSFFGKNPANISPVILGGFLFSRFVGKPFSNYVVPVLLSTALSPAVSQAAISNDNTYIGLLFAIVVGVGIGFIIVPVAKSCVKSHDGNNLYNVGFAGGILAMLIMAVFKNYGVDFAPVYIISSGNNFIISTFIFSLSFFLICAGFICSDNPETEISRILNTHWISNNFYAQIKESSYINMGFLGIVIIMFVNMYGASISGPTIGGIYTIIGFGCFGKTIKNITPIMLGAIIASFSSIHKYNDTLPVITILFSTCLAPLAEHFGFGYGVVAGFLHFNLALNTSMVHGGLNLYNNGLAGGFTAMLLVPVIKALRENKAKKPETVADNIKPQIDKEEADLSGQDCSAD